MTEHRTEHDQQVPIRLTPAQKLEECRKAGHWIEWVDCWNGCDEGWHTDLHEIDPLLYDEDDMILVQFDDYDSRWVRDDQIR